LQQPEGKTMSLSEKHILRIAPSFSGNRPIDFFNLLVTNEFLELMVKETNRYAEDVFSIMRRTLKDQQ
jgi:hypothetical protein